MTPQTKEIPLFRDQHRCLGRPYFMQPPVVQRLPPLLECKTMGRKRNHPTRSSGNRRTSDLRSATRLTSDGSDRSSFPLRVLRLLPFAIASVMLLPWNLP